MAEVVHLLLSRAGLRVTTVADGKEGLSQALTGHFDLVVLDVLLPSMDGFEICRRIREEATTPIVMLTARAGTSDAVAGLELGADDYVTKPFEGPELVARVRAVLRRAGGRPGEPPLAVGAFRLDPAAFKAWKADVPLVLTPTEFRLLQEFLLNPGTVLTREALLHRVWEYQYVGDTRLVDMAILRLRDKIEDDPRNPVFVTTVRGVGYCFDQP